MLFTKLKMDDKKLEDKLEEGQTDDEYEPSSKDSLCIRLQRCISHNPVLNYLLPICVVIILILVIYFCKDYAKSVLFWVENQNSWLVFIVFMLLFSIVSFPVTIGYLVLIITSGYLFGIIKGILTVVLGANLGVAVAHNTIKSVQTKLPVHK